MTSAKCIVNMWSVWDMMGFCVMCRVCVEVYGQCMYVQSVCRGVFRAYVLWAVYVSLYSECLCYVQCLYRGMGIVYVQSVCSECIICKCACYLQCVYHIQNMFVSYMHFVCFA